MKPAFSHQAVIFDLDGTLIDSAPGILCSFERVLKRAGIHPLVPINDSLIGPPLRQTLVTLTGISKDKELDTLVEFFKDSYDSEGCRNTRVYDGVGKLLATLASKKVPMAIATNKRKIPTHKIIKFLGWEHYFRMIGTLDSRTPPYQNKAAMINTLLYEMSVDAATSVYVGDKLEDGEAAEENQMPFIAVEWGYGEWDAKKIKPGWILVSSPVEAMGTLIVE
jgi:phosphoglycolate phosphatase